MTEPRVVAAFIGPQDVDWQGSTVNVLDDGSWWVWQWTPAPPGAPGDAPLWPGVWLQIRPPVDHGRATPAEVQS